MIHRFLEKDDSPKPTLAVDYSYGRKAGKSLVKDIVHVWEIGQISPSLISATLKGCSLTHSYQNVTIIILLNLSLPEIMWNTLEECLNALNIAIKSNIEQSVISKLKETRLKELQKNTDKNEKIDPFPLRICIIGAKYDDFVVCKKY